MEKGHDFAKQNITFASTNGQNGIGRATDTKLAFASNPHTDTVTNPPYPPDPPDPPDAGTAETGQARFWSNGKTRGTPPLGEAESTSCVQYLPPGQGRG